MTTAAEPNAETLDDADRAEMLLALTPDVGPVLRQRLLERFGDAGRALHAEPRAVGEGRLAPSGPPHVRDSLQQRGLRDVETGQVLPREARVRRVFTHGRGAHRDGVAPDHRERVPATLERRLQNGGNRVDELHRQGDAVRDGEPRA